MLIKIYKELVAIRKELQSIRNAMELVGERKHKSIVENTSINDISVSMDWDAALKRLEKFNH